MVVFTAVVACLLTNSYSFRDKFCLSVTRSWTAGSRSSSRLGAPPRWKGTGAGACRLYPPRLSVSGSNQRALRTSPSVTTSTPASSCSAIACMPASSWISSSSPSEIDPASLRSIASLSAGGRSRLPITSACNGFGVSLPITKPPSTSYAIPRRVAGASTSNVGRVLQAKKLRLAAFSVGHVRSWYAPSLRHGSAEYLVSPLRSGCVSCRTGVQVGALPQACFSRRRTSQTSLAEALAGKRSGTALHGDPSEFGELLDRRRATETAPSAVLNSAERHLRLVVNRLVVDVDDPGL